MTNRPLLTNSSRVSLAILAASLFLSGCQSPYYADRGAGFGALAGAGTGAIVGNAVGDTGAGLAIGAGLGALTGAVVGNSMDQMAAENRAQIAAHMGRQVQAGAANAQEVVAMTQAGVDPRLIQNYVRTSGLSQPLTANDVIYLHNQGVSSEVIQTMQNPMPANAPLVAGRPPIIVQEHFYGPPHCYGPHYGYYHGPRHGRHFSSLGAFQYRSEAGKRSQRVELRLGQP